MVNVSTINYDDDDDDERSGVNIMVVNDAKLLITSLRHLLSTNSFEHNFLIVNIGTIIKSHVEGKYFKLFKVAHGQLTFTVRR